MRRRSFLAGLSAALLSACGGGSDAPLNSSQAQVPKPLIVAVGDSLTAAYMPDGGARLVLDQARSYTAELKPLGRVVTAAVGGSTTEAARTNQLHWLAPLVPDVVVVMLGTNDAAYQLDRTASLANMDAIVTAWPKARVVIVSPPHWDTSTDPWMSGWSQDLKRLAAQRGARFVDVYAESLRRPWQCVTDDHHPCADAHREIGQMVAAAVQAALSHP